MNYAENTPIILAHRGGAGEAPENSLQAFNRAVKNGSKYLETDVRIGVDGKLYLTHNSPKSTRDYATLEELFKRYPNCYFAIDPKHKATIKPLAKLIVEKNKIGQVCIGASIDSRAKAVAEEIKKLSGKQVATALVSAGASIDLILNARRIAQRKQTLHAQYIHVHKKVISPRTIRIAHENGLKIIAWVVNDKETMLRFLSWGIDGFMTDYPSVAKSVQ